MNSPTTSVAELASALHISRQAVAKKFHDGLFGPNIGDGSSFVFALDKFADAEARGQLEAHREGRARAEAVEVLKDCLPVKQPLRSLLDLTDAQRREARWRADLLLWCARKRREEGLTWAHAIIKAKAEAELVATCAFRELLTNGQNGRCQINGTNVMRWLALWRPHRRHELDEYGWWSLADNYASPVKAREGDERYWHHLALLYEGGNQITLTDAYWAVLKKGEREGWGEPPTINQVKYWYGRKADKLAVQARRRGEKFIYNTVDLPVRRDWNIPFGAMWFSDHHLFNVFVRIPAPWAPGYWLAVRPWITQFLDCPTMHEVASIIRGRDPDGDVILETWRKAVDALNWSAETVVFDNGKDYRSIGGPRIKLKALDESKMSTTASILGVRASFALPFNARAKPCELDFSEVEEKFERRWPTYCGHNTERFKVIWPSLKREKLAKFDGENNPVRGCLVNPELVPTLDEFADAYYTWRRDERESKPIEGIMLDGAIPAVAWADGLKACQRPAIDAQTRFVAFLRAFQKPQRVGKGGVVWFKRGERQRDWIRYASPALFDYLASGQEVLVKIDTRDVAQCYVFREIATGWKLIDCGGPMGGCPSVADIPANTGMELVRDSQRANRQTRKAIRAGENAIEREAALREFAGQIGGTDTEANLIRGADPAINDALNEFRARRRENRSAVRDEFAAIGDRFANAFEATTP